MNIIKPMKTIASISALCAFMTFSSIASFSVAADDNKVDAPKHHSNKAGKSKHSMKRMFKGLSLSEEQKTQMKAVKTQAKDEHEVLSVSMKEYKQAEKALIQAEQFDASAYTSLRLAYQQTFADAALNSAKTRNAIFNILTEEQKEKFLKKMGRNKGKSKGKSKEKSAL